MNKKFLNVFLFSALCLGTTGTFTSCKDYDDDIENLQSQIDAAKVTLDELQALIKSGSVISDVTSTSNGVVITLSNGKTYTLTNGKDGANGQDGKDGANGQDGKDGVNGKDAVVWTIGTDGYWYQDGKKTNYKAIGMDGKDGQNGQDGQDGQNGQDGKDGQNGKYYVPNPNGFFDIYQDGKKIESTQISWKAAGVSAVYSGNKLVLNGVEGTDSPVEIIVGTPLGSVAFVPDKTYSNPSTGMVTTSNSFYSLRSYLDESKFDPTTKAFIQQNDFKKSNIVDMVYRLNPTDAYLSQDAHLGFINRVVTRAAGDKTDLLNVNSWENNGDGSLTVKATINQAAFVTGLNGETNYAALSVWNGQSQVVSDYVYIRYNQLNLALVDSTKTLSNGSAVTFSNRTQKIQGNDETDAFIKQFCPLTTTAHKKMSYTDGLDLTQLPGLYCVAQRKFLAEMGFTGINYTYSLPKEYKSNDAQGTNQQWYVKLEGNKLVVNAENLPNGTTPAIGRTPVVRIDAFMKDNEGVNRLVASAYVKIEIAQNAPTTGDPAQAIPADISATKEYEYHNVTAADMMVGQMTWQDVNNVIYGKTGLTANTFWSHYNTTYDVKATVVKQDGTTYEFINGTATAASTPSIFTQNGVSCEVLLGDQPTQTSNIKVSVNNTVMTENTYKDVEGKGAEYTVTITIKSLNRYAYGDIVLTQKFYVKEDCTSFKYNPLYHINSFNGVAGDYVKVKGSNATGTWVMSSNVSEHFEMINNQDIFTYALNTNNATAIDFAWATGVTGATYNSSTHEVKLNAAMTELNEVKKMNYKVTLANGEKCEFSYNIIFVNPFKGTNASALQINGNTIGTTTLATNKSVKVVDNDNAVIYSYVNNALALSDKAQNTYKITTAPTVSYAFKNDDPYKEVISQIGSNATLAIDNTGKITWENNGTTLQGTRTLTVEVTVEFDGLSKVKCSIPVQLIGE